MFRITRHIISFIALALAAISCVGGGAGDSNVAADSLFRMPDTLRVATLYSPTSYFIYRETPMGYDYDLVTRFARDKGCELDLTIAPSLSAAVEMLDSGEIDIIAYDVPVTSDYRRHTIPAGRVNVTSQVLVQPLRGKLPKVTDVTQLAGREVYVEENSKYHQRLENLNNEIGGGIIIRPISRDTLITEDLIAMVSDGEIPLTVVDSDIARLNASYYPSLDITLPLSLAQKSAWAVSPSAQWLADSIDTWQHQATPVNIQASLLKRYFERSKAVPSFSASFNFSSGRMSQFDNLFRTHSRSLGWDWRLVSAMGFAESRYDSTQVSWAGAKGIMQLMPSTARHYGLPEELMNHNEPSIRTAVKVIKSLDKIIAKHVSDPVERQKFVVAAYNSGPAHILDAIALARKYGRQPDIWEGNVAETLMLKSHPEYYNDPVCKYGYFSGRQTIEYVKRVFATYHKAQKQVPL